MPQQPAWEETDSRDFLDLAEIAVPAREEQMRALFDLIPATMHRPCRRNGSCIPVLSVIYGEYH